jgi:bifunctional UDP-N-acetylglucosamine pyrophosphorylase / glucosamine-1-phosphate N-acetyltransferase
MSQPVTFVILAAGLGVRMKSRKAKVLHRAGGKALVEHVVEAALQLAPPERVFVVVGHQAAEVRAAVTAAGVRFIHQEEQKGTGHAVMAGREALSHLGGWLTILYGDCPLLRAETLRRLIESAAASEAAGTMLTALLDDPTGYGRVIRDAHGRPTAIVEQKAATPEQLSIREANMGIYCYRAELFWRHIDSIQPNNPAREYYLTDLVEILSRAGHPVEAIQMDDPREALGINTRVELADVDRLFRERKAKAAMLSGVTIEKPETVTIDAGVEIGMDTVIEPFAQILGKTKIGENCRIGACAVVKDSELGEGVELGAFTIVNTSRLERGAHAGPFARLRQDNHLSEGARIGNFVELKKARIGARSKAMHLAYLGDSELGSDVNVGAGTITCNYDGAHKHATKIGDGAFIGSNSTLVAPIEIGEGAYLAAGSVITEPVPPDALALGRARQTTKEEWASKRRALRKTGFGRAEMPK